MLEQKIRLQFPPVSMILRKPFTRVYTFHKASLGYYPILSVMLWMSVCLYFWLKEPFSLGRGLEKRYLGEKVQKWADMGNARGWNSQAVAYERVAMENWKIQRNSATMVMTVCNRRSTGSTQGKMQMVCEVTGWEQDTEMAQEAEEQGPSHL